MDLEKDEDLFKGHGDYQFDIYRKMRRQIGKDWTVSCPKTNLFVSGLGCWSISIGQLGRAITMGVVS